MQKAIQMHRTRHTEWRLCSSRHFKGATSDPFSCCSWEDPTRLGKKSLIGRCSMDLFKFFGHIHIHTFQIGVTLQLFLHHAHSSSNTKPKLEAWNLHIIVSTTGIPAPAILQQNWEIWGERQFFFHTWEYVFFASSACNHTTWRECLIDLHKSLYYD
jgi:hypothetical protein